MGAKIVGFQPERLVGARIARDLTQTALAQLVGRSKGTVSKWESGQQTPEREALGTLAEALDVPREYFHKPPRPTGNRPCFFRSMASTTKRARARIAERLAWLEGIGCDLQQWLDLPPLDLPDLRTGDFRRLDESDIEEAAYACRQHWRLGRAPIQDLILVLENAGIVTARDAFGAPSIDGVSRWCEADGRGYIITSSDKRTAVRTRFDAAHELGHLVLHREVPASALADSESFGELERQAHRFASAFLLPAESFANEIGAVSLDGLLSLKSRWRVSVGAMIVRCRDLGIASEEHATRLFKYLSARGWRRREPLDDELPIERPRLLERSIRLLLTDGGLTCESLLAELRLAPADVETLTGLPPGLLGSPADRIAMLPMPKLKAQTVANDTRAPVVPLRRTK